MSNKDEIQDFTPQILCNGEYTVMLLKTEMCPKCLKTMMKEDKLRYSGVFPVWRELNQQSQMKKAGIVFQSMVKSNNRYICVECAEGNKATIHCALCKQDKPSNKQKESFGCDPAEFLCSDCYETVPAKVWEEKVEKLQENIVMTLNKIAN